MKYFIDITYMNPKSGRSVERTGPIFDRAAIDKLCVELLRKRNVVAIKVMTSRELNNLNSNKGESK